MSILAVEVEPLAYEVNCTEYSLRVLLADGREIAAPLVWFHACRKLRRKKEKIGV